MEGTENNKDDNRRDEVFSKAVRAGKRTYFFDVKATRAEDYYLTVTESKKRFKDNGDFFYEKHKLFIYKEDFEKFEDGLRAAIAKIEELKSSGEYKADEPENKIPAPSSNEDDSSIESIEFEDL